MHVCDLLRITIASVRLK